MKKYENKISDSNEKKENLRDELEAVTKKDLSYLQEEIILRKENTDYKALCDKADKIKAKIKIEDFEYLEKLRALKEKYDGNEELKNNIDGVMACYKMYIERLDVEGERVNLRNKLKNKN